MRSVKYEARGRDEYAGVTDSSGLLKYADLGNDVVQATHIESGDARQNLHGGPSASDSISGGCVDARLVSSMASATFSSAIARGSNAAWHSGGDAGVDNKKPSGREGRWSLKRCIGRSTQPTGVGGGAPNSREARRCGANNLPPSMCEIPETEASLLSV